MDPRVTAAARLVAAELEAVEERLVVITSSGLGPIADVGRVLVGSGGKRLRPMVALLSARATGVAVDDAVGLATVAELIHSATLLHDDVVDEGELRRGRPAARMELGNGIAVLVGDLYLAKALGLVAEVAKGRCVASLAAMVAELAEGEILQLGSAGRADVGVEHVAAIAERKTASLFGWCASLGGLADPALLGYGRALGRAFQVADDVLDCAGGDGKRRGQDLREGKLTLPIVLACEADAALRARVAAVLSRRVAPEEVDALLDAVQRSGGTARALEVARAHAAHAVEALDALPGSPAVEGLAALATFAVSRAL